MYVMDILGHLMAILEMEPCSTTKSTFHCASDPKPYIAPTHQQLAAVLQRKPAEVPPLRVAQRSKSPIPLPNLKSASLDLTVTHSTSRKRSSTESCVDDTVNNGIDSKPPILPKVPQHQIKKSSASPAVFTYGNISTPDSGVGSEPEDRKQLKKLKSELTQVISMIDDLTNKYDILQNEVKQLRKAVNMPVEEGAIASSIILKQTSSSAQVERNVEELRTLNCDQVEVHVYY